ncbi:hypothetical protein CBS147333_3645 [Penicillium roqueforti]|nr:hypothetical protein CBS147372_9128 [Penicillium roqueforti]KAI2710718.1 hypothetical protein CBS147354_8558 [Penicillium roqueforti]KAI3112671.1 hypothetical protein CBS147333_3645 [Penicillium roqueforti]KAI3128706.1 hypothetical protein CBS147326_6731 [Penicillium roqueforti]KAI3149800.1 hypothetical protein CBS147317_7786 [Penicillium roqueforti]
MAIAEPHLITAVQVTVFPVPVRPPSQPRTVPVVLLGRVLLAQIQALGPAAQSMAIVELVSSSIRVQSLQLFFPTGKV